MKDIRWGFELEMHLGQLDHNAKTVKITIDNEKLFEDINKSQMGLDAHIEYGAWMIELVPTTAI